MPRCPAGKNTGIIHQDIHASVPLPNCLNSPLDLVFPGDVTNRGVGVRTRTANLGASVGSIADVENLDSRSVSRQPQGNRFANSHGRARYDCHTILQSTQSPFLLYWVLAAGDNSPRSFFNSP